MSCLITKKLEAIPTGQPLPSQRASDDVKLCTCQIRTCAGEGEHMFASARLVVWRNKESVLANVKESKVCKFSENLYITSDLVVRIRIVKKVKARLDSDENRDVLFRGSLGLISLTIAVRDCISVGDHMIRSGFNKSIATSFLFCEKMYIP